MKLIPTGGRGVTFELNRRTGFGKSPRGLKNTTLGLGIVPYTPRRTDQGGTDKGS